MFAELTSTHEHSAAAAVRVRAALVFCISMHTQKHPVSTERRTQPAESFEEKRPTLELFSCPLEPALHIAARLPREKATLQLPAQRIFLCDHGTPSLGYVHTRARPRKGFPLRRLSAPKHHTTALESPRSCLPGASLLVSPLRSSKALSFLPLEVRMWSHPRAALSSC